MPDKLRVRLHKSPISYTAKARGTVRALGLHRLHETVEVPDNPATRGMVRAIRFLVEVEEVPEKAAARPARRRGSAEGTATPASASAAAHEAPAAAPAAETPAGGEPAAAAAEEEAE